MVILKSFATAGLTIATRGLENNSLRSVLSLDAHNSVIEAQCLFHDECV